MTLLRVNLNCLRGLIHGARIVPIQSPCTVIQLPRRQSRDPRTGEWTVEQVQ